MAMIMKTQGTGKQKKAKKAKYNDLGFGSTIVEAHRFINKDGSLNVTRRGYSSWTPYQTLVEMSWPQFLLVVVCFYIGINFFFAISHVMIGIETLAGVTSQGVFNDLGQAFFFSVQTFTTVGYGSLSPTSFGANLVSALNALTGLMSFALATGLFFARFAKPKAQILFSEKGLIAPYRGITSFQFRIANIRNNKIINLEAQVVMAWLEETSAGVFNRRFALLPLERSKVILFPLNWTIVHPIDENSPIYGKTEEDFKNLNVEFMVLVKGYDETFAQEVHANSSYIASEVVWNARFRRMFHDEKEKTILDLDLIDDIEMTGTAGERQPS